MANRVEGPRHGRLARGMLDLDDESIAPRLSRGARFQLAQVELVFRERLQKAVKRARGVRDRDQKDCPRRDPVHERRGLTSDGHEPRLVVWPILDVRRENVESVVRSGDTAGERCSPHPHVYSDRMLRPGDPAYFDILHSFMGYRTCYYRTFAVASASKALVDAYKRCRYYLDAAIALIKPGATTGEVVQVWPKAQEFGFPDEEAAFALQFGHGVGLTIWEKPVFSRLVSIDHPEVIEEGMVFALETFWPSSDGWSAARIEEQLVVTADGCEVITKFPAEELLVAGRRLGRPWLIAHGPRVGGTGPVHGRRGVQGLAAGEQGGGAVHGRDSHEPVDDSARHVRGAEVLSEDPRHEVELGDIRLSFFPLRFRAESLTVRHHGRVDVPPLLVIQSLVLHLNLLDLWGQVIDRVAIDGMELNVPPRPEVGGPRLPMTSEHAGGGTPDVVIRHLTTTNTRIAVIPPRAHGDRPRRPQVDALVLDHGDQCCLSSALHQ